MSRRIPNPASAPRGSRSWWGRSKFSAASSGQRSGVAVVELAIMLPLLVFLFVITVDFARVFYFSVTLTNCARAGALYAFDPVSAAESPFTSASQAALADATNLSPQPVITTTNGVDASGMAYVDVTASYPFTTVTNFPGVPSLQLSRTVRMFMAPIVPNTN
jgi:Flp pilus assembly protein TadG